MSIDAIHEAESEDVGSTENNYGRKMVNVVGSEWAAVHGRSRTTPRRELIGASLLDEKHDEAAAETMNRCAYDRGKCPLIL